MKELMMEGALVLLGCFIVALLLGTEPTSLKNTVGSVMGNQIEFLKRTP